MNYKWIGALLVVVGCGGFGFSLASSYRKEESMLRQILSVLDFMECQLQYQLTPLPELCRMAGRGSSGTIRDILIFCAQELEQQISPDAYSCMICAVAKAAPITYSVRQVFAELGKTLGRFDLSGQLKGLDGVRTLCNNKLRELESNRDVRLRGYQTLGLCAGAALAILFV